MKLATERKCLKSAARFVQTHSNRAFNDGSGHDFVLLLEDLNDVSCKDQRILETNIISKNSRATN